MQYTAPSTGASTASARGRLPPRMPTEPSLSQGENQGAQATRAQPQPSLSLSLLPQPRLRLKPLKAAVHMGSRPAGAAGPRRRPEGGQNAARNGGPPNLN